MKTKRTLWRAIGASAIIALIGFGVAGCDNGSGPLAQHTVTFNTHGGSVVQSQTVEEGQRATMPAAPTRADHNFVGWFTAQTGGTQFDFNTPITGPTTVHAQWEPVQQTPSLHIVTFNTHGGNTVTSQEVPHGETATRPETDPTRANHNFVNWFTDETDGTPFNFDTPITVPTTIHARWIAVHTVNFDTHSSTFPMPDQHVEHGQRATRPATNPTRAEYVFIDWFTAETGGEPFDFDTAITADTTIHAQWFETTTTMAWTAIPAGDAGSTFSSTLTIRGVAYGSGMWVAFCEGGRMAHSADGISWTAIPAGDAGSTFPPSNPPGNINAVAYGNGMWVAVGNQGRMAYSADGMSWTAIPAMAGGSTFPTGFAGHIHRVAYGSGRWVAVGVYGRMAYSADGMSWTAIPVGDAGETDWIRGVAYSNGRWVAVGEAGRMAYSANGTSWTAIPAGDAGSTFPSDREYLITGVAYGNGRWVAVGWEGRMAYSADGISWTAIPAGAGGSTFPSGTFGWINGVAYGNGRWVAVANGGRMAYFTED